MNLLDEVQGFHFGELAGSKGERRDISDSKNEVYGGY